MATVSAAEYVAVETSWSTVVSLTAVGAPFRAVLIRADSRWFEDDATPELVEHVLCEREFSLPLPAVFGAVDEWLFQGHKLRVLAHTWTPCESGPDVGVALLLEARAVPVHPLPGPLGCWSA